MSARKRYPSDLTDLQWDNIEPLFPPQGRPAGRPGRPRTYPLREIVNAVLYLARGGCAWRMLPHDFPPWKTVSYYFYTWRDAGRLGAGPRRPAGRGPAAGRPGADAQRRRSSTASR